MTSIPAALQDDIRDRADVSALVVDFYTCAFADDLLGPIFVDIAHLDLASHLPIMCDFWESILFGSGSYRRNAMARHAALHRKAGLTSPHFDRWLRIWVAAVDRSHAGPVAERAKLMGARIAQGMATRILGIAGHERAGLTGIALDGRSSSPTGPRTIAEEEIRGRVRVVDRAPTATASPAPATPASPRPPKRPPPESTRA